MKELSKIEIVDVTGGLIGSKEPSLLDAVDPSTYGGEAYYYKYDDGSSVYYNGDGRMSCFDADGTSYEYDFHFSLNGCVTLAAQAVATYFSRGAASYANAAAGAAAGCVTITRTPVASP